ncbi:antitoxin [Streptomyces sp. RB6PN25]|uniref:Antitoxin n=1 Tax=Streptomyces humicola TaxID=2953240 RepID=A0ABT1Q0X6_9ACTN|nr:antitoxin [Streptomyces humicola]MCQ4082945.1 antitoxin [Streptomyces humicola]
MGFLDAIKGRFSKGKAEDLARRHGDKVDTGMDKASQQLDEGSGGKYSEQIQTGTEKAKDTLGNLDKDQGGTDGGAPS